jgi:Zn-dependent protease
VPLGAEILLTTGLANTILAAFNLLPIPPLDGSAVLERLLPKRWLEPYLQLRRLSFFLFIGLFLVGGDVLGRVFSPAIELWLKLLPI